VDRHDEAVVGGHAGLLEDHVAAQGVGLLRGDRHLAGLGVEALGLLRLHRLRPHIAVGVVGGHRAVGLEEGPAVLHRGDPAGVGAGVDAADLGEGVDEAVPVDARRLEVLVRAERGRDLTRPGGVVLELDVVRQVVARIVRGGDELDLEAVVQRARQERRRLQLLGDRVVDLVRGLGRRGDVDPEDVGELGLEPELDRAAPVDLPVGAEEAERVAGAVGAEVLLTHAEVGERDPVGVQHPIDVVVGRDQQRGRVAERHVVGQPLGRHVPVGGDDGQVADGLVDLTRDGAQRGISREHPVGAEVKSGHTGSLVGRRGACHPLPCVAQRWTGTPLTALM